MTPKWYTRLALGVFVLLLLFVTINVAVYDPRGELRGAAALLLVYGIGIAILLWGRSDVAASRISTEVTAVVSSPSLADLVRVQVALESRVIRLCFNRSPRKEQFVAYRRDVSDGWSGGYYSDSPLDAVLKALNAMQQDHGKVFL